MFSEHNTPYLLKLDGISYPGLRIVLQCPLTNFSVKAAKENKATIACINDMYAS